MTNILIDGDIIAIHPGKHIEEYLADEDMTQTEFAKRLDVSKALVSKLVNGDAELNEDLIARLSDVMGTSREYWRNLNVSYLDKKRQIDNKEQLEKEEEIVRKIDFSFWTELGILKPASKAVDKVKQLRKYLNISDLTVLERPDLLTRYRRTTNKAQEKNIISTNAWIQTAINYSKNEHVAKINLNYLTENLPKIKAMTTQDPQIFIPQLREILAQSGIKFVLLPYLKNSELNGAVKWINHGENALLMMNNKLKNSDVFWFSLFHEIKHVYQEKKKIIIITPSKKTLIDDSTDKVLEDEADNFARDYLINEADYNKFSSDKSNLKRDSIIKFAEKEGIHPGIVVGRLQKDRIIPYHEFNQLKVRYVFKLQEKQ